MNSMRLNRLNSYRSSLNKLRVFKQSKHPAKPLLAPHLSILNLTQNFILHPTSLLPSLAHLNNVRPYPSPNSPRPRPHPPHPMRTLRLPARHHRHQARLLRALLRLHQLPRRVRGPSFSRVAACAARREGGPVREVQARAFRRRVYALWESVYGMWERV